MADGDFKDLPWRAASVKILRNKAFDFAKSLEYGGCQRGLASRIYNFFDKKTSGATSGGGINDENMSDQQIPEELYKPIIGNLKNKKYTHFYRQYLGCWSF